jgi:penicillin-binding protein-related factor A (putative recombinase)
MGKNAGKDVEDDFEDILTTFGKRAYYHRLMDASDVRGLTGKAGHVGAQPSDYILVFDGKTSFAEVKSTENPISFPFSLLRKTQSAAAVQIEGAGGDYTVFVKSKTRDRWFCFPYKLVRATRDAGRSSLKWTELGGYQWLV